MDNPNHNFRNPSDQLGPAASDHVQALLSSVDAAHAALGELDSTGHAFLERPFAAIRADLADGKCTVETVVKHHLRATVAASLATHCLTALPWQEALQRARELDRLHADNAQALPLRGMAFSVKDCIHVAGIAVTLGCSSRLDAVPERSAMIVERLERLGAVLVAKTACPQASMSNTTASPLWGLVRSPYGEEYQVGGSSGGEAALVHLCGSMLGVGTDTGGSVRQPATLNELVGFKFSSTPSSGLRFEQGRDFTTGLPQTTVPATACGLFTRDVDTMTVTIRALGLIADSVAPTTHRLGYSTFEASPEVQSAIQWAVKDNGRAVRVLEGRADEWAKSWMDAACADGFDAGLKMVGTDPLLPTSMFTAKLPGVERSAAHRHVQSLRDHFNQVLAEDEVNLLAIPSYAYGRPVTDKTFFESPRAELWLQTINLMEWPAISLPLPVSNQILERWEDADAKDLDSSADMARVWPQLKDFVRQPLPSQRRATISIQLTARPGEESRILAFADELVRRGHSS